MGQVVLDLPQEHLLTLLVHQVPLVVDQDQGTACVNDLLDDAHVLLADRLGGVQEDDGDLGLVDGALRAQDRVVVGAPRLLDAPADPGGIDEDPLAPVKLNDLVDRVPGGAGGLVDDDAFPARDGVQQRGLADIGPPHEGNPV